MLLQSLLTGALAGLASTPHCAAMCGPLCAASCASPGATSLRAQRAPLVRYQLGRTIGYAFAGTVAGGLGASVRDSLHGPAASLVLSGMVALSLLVLARRVWRGSGAPSQLVQLTGRTRRTWFSRLAELVPREPAFVGTLTALLPCGALAAALLLAAGTQERLAGMLVMLGFASTSALGVLGGGLVLDKLARLRGHVLPRVLAVAIGALALFVGLRPLYALATHDPRADEPAAHSCH